VTPSQADDEWPFGLFTDAEVAELQSAAEEIKDAVANQLLELTLVFTPAEGEAFINAVINLQHPVAAWRLQQFLRVVASGVRRKLDSR
jgi:hypothetical protein